MRDRELYDDYKDYFTCVIDLLKQKVDQGETVRNSTEQDIVFEITQTSNEQSKAGCGCGFPLVSKPDYQSFAFNKMGEFKNLKNYDKCLNRFKALSEDDFFHEQGYLGNPILDYVERTQGFYFDQSVFLRIYQEIENYLFEGLIAVEYSAKLINFSSNLSEIILDSDIRIKPYTVDECKRIWQKSQLQRSWLNVTSPLDFKIEAILKVPRNVLNTASQEGFEVIRRVLLLLRLFKTRVIRIGPIHEESIDWTPLHGRRFSGLDSPAPGEYYFLKNEELSDLLNLWGKLKKINFTNVPDLKVAIKRFNYAHERSDWEDKLLDIMIGFEALFSDGKAELQYKSSLRTAVFIGENQEERRRIFEIIKVAYGYRSSLVHGASIDDKVLIKALNSEEMNKGAFINLLLEYLSRSIKKFITLSPKYTKEKIIQEIHRSTLEGSFS